MILLTGATGFLGRPLLRRLIMTGSRVLVLGRTAPEFLAPAERARVSFLQADLERPASLKRHRAALAAAEEAVLAGGFVLRSSRPEDDFAWAAQQANVDGTATLLTLLRPSLRWLCYVSTVDVYGTPRKLPMKESHPAQPRTNYGKSKLASEELVLSHARKAKVPAAVLRLAQVYGPGDASAKAIPAFLKAGADGGPVTISGTGAQKRSYLFLDDAIEAVLLARERAARGVFNVAGPEATVRQAAALAAKLTKTKLVAAPGPVGVSLTLDGRAAKKAFGFSPKVSLADGMARTLDP